MNLEPDPRWAADRYRRAVAGEPLLEIYAPVQLLRNSQWLRDRDELRLADEWLKNGPNKATQVSKEQRTMCALAYLAKRKGF